MTLTLAIPSKGRLKEQCEAWLSRLGSALETSGGGRGYSASIPGLANVTVQLLSAGSIAAALDNGEAHLGVTDEILNFADETLAIPMYGFTESFNVSVCAALCMYELTKRIRQEVKGHHLGEEEKTAVYLEWLKTSVDHSEGLIKNFLNQKKI